MVGSIAEIKSIFNSALEISSAVERDAYLARACGGDVRLRSEVESLLQAGLAASGFLAELCPAPGATIDQPINERAGDVIGAYKLLEPIGEGGFGVVFMAEQMSPVRRKVAFKVLKPGMDTRQVIARFEAERQALAIMDHPNIAKVFDGGATPLGRPYFVMELVKGMPITEFCDQNQLSPNERLELFIPVCQAVQHAHQKGIIHRDLKPSNVLVTVHDTLAVPKVIDFGVAKALGRELTDKTLFTGFAQMVGTPLYMSPEQAGQSGLDVDTRSDIYSLGVLLYELLTGTTPFDKERFRKAAYDEIVRIIREEEPPKPSTRLAQSTETLPMVSARRQMESTRLTKLVYGELDWIVMKCLEKDRNRRYESPAALVGDLKRFLSDEPVLACPPSAGYRLRKFARRHKAALATVAASVLFVVLAVAGLATSTALIARALTAETKAKDELDETLKRARIDTYYHRITLAHHALIADDLGRALKLLDECPEDLRDWEWHYLMRLCRVQPLIIRDNTEVNGFSFNSDGDRFASAGGDGFIKIWNLATGELIKSFLAHKDAVVSVAFHPGGRHVASRGADRTVKVWDLAATDQAMFTEPCDPTRKFGSAYTIAFSPDGRLLAAGTDDVVKVWDWKNHELVHRLPGHGFHSVPVAFSGDGRLATGSFRDGLRIWDSESGILLHTLAAIRHPASALAFSSDSQWLATASFDRTAKLLDSRTGAIRHSFDLHSGNVECVAINPNGRLLASGGEDKTVRVWHAATGREVLALPGHTERCACVAFSPDGLRLVSASADRTIRVWDGRPLRGDERQETLTFNKHTDEIRSVASSPGSLDDAVQRVASGSSDGLVRVWDASTGRVSAEFSGHEMFSGKRGPIFCVAWHPKGRLIASAAIDTVIAWDPRTEEIAFSLPATTGRIVLPYQAVAFSPDGRYLVTGKVDGAVQVWDGETGDRIGTLDTHKREIRGLVFSRNGEHLASASSDGEVKIWNARQLDKLHLDAKPQPRIPPIRARVAGPGLSVAFSPDGAWLATGGEEFTLKIWDVQTGRELKSQRGHGGDIYAVATSPDGRWVASAGEDSTVKVWDSHNEFKLDHSFRGHTGIVCSLAFSSDGKRLYSGSRDKTVKVWDLTPLINAPVKR